MSEPTSDRLADYLRGDHRFDDASLWVSPRRVDAPNYMGTEIKDDQPDREFTYTDFMVFAWPAQFSGADEDQRKLWNVVERLVIQARLNALPTGMIGI